MVEKCLFEWNGYWIDTYDIYSIQSSQQTNCHFILENLRHNIVLSTRGHAGPGLHWPTSGHLGARCHPIRYLDGSVPIRWHGRHCKVGDKIKSRQLLSSNDNVNWKGKLILYFIPSASILSSYTWHQEEKILNVFFFLSRDSFVVSGKYKIPNVVSVSASKLIRKMLATNPKERVTFKDIVRSDWLKQTVEDHIELMPSDPVDIVRKSELCSCQIRHERLSSDGKMQMYIASGDEQRQVESRSCSSDGRSIGAEKTSWGSLKRSVNRKWSNLWRRRVLSRLQSRSKWE